MIVIVTESIPDRLRGFLSRLFLEVRAGVYIGDYSDKVKNEIWNKILIEKQTGNIVIAWDSKTSHGFSFECIGENRRQEIFIDEVQFVAKQKNDMITL